MKLTQLGNASSAQAQLCHYQNVFLRRPLNCSTCFFCPKLAMQLGDVSKCCFNKEAQLLLCGFDVRAPYML